jgi:hypothetical protein
MCGRIRDGGIKVEGIKDGSEVNGGRIVKEWIRGRIKIEKVIIYGGIIQGG